MPGSIRLMMLAMGLGAEPVDHLALAAAALDRGQASQAITHLTVHIQSNPREVMTRAYLAELLFRERRFAESTVAFEQVIAAAYTMTGKPHEHLIHCHTRLMSIAEDSGDAYREHLHRGIGLWRLVAKWNSADAMSERTLIQAREALVGAKALRDDARVNLYLAEVDLLLKQSPAESLRAAMTCPPTGLNAAERSRLAELRRAN